MTSHSLRRVTRLYRFFVFSDKPWILWALEVGEPPDNCLYTYNLSPCPSSPSPSPPPPSPPFLLPSSGDGGPGVSWYFQFLNLCKNQCKIMSHPPVAFLMNLPSPLPPPGVVFEKFYEGANTLSRYSVCGRLSLCDHGKPVELSQAIPLCLASPPPPLSSCCTLHFCETCLSRHSCCVGRPVSTWSLLLFRVLQGSSALLRKHSL